MHLQGTRFERAFVASFTASAPAERSVGNCSPGKHLKLQHTVVPTKNEERKKEQLRTFTVIALKLSWSVVTPLGASQLMF